MNEFLRQHRPIVVLVLVVLCITVFPPLAAHFVLKDAWAGIMPSFTDEAYYYAPVHTIAEGYFTDGNPFFFEHRNGPPLVLFGGAWLNALPLIAGVPFNVALVLNFIIWSFLFVAALYRLFREWRTPEWAAVAGTLFIYVQSIAHVWRAVNLQTVYPVYALFYVALARFVREQSRINIALLAGVIAISFYLFAYLWQIAAITLGLLFLYALTQRNWQLAKATLIASGIGLVLGLPVPLYMLVWLPHHSPYFWESMYRLGLVDTHLPMAEIIYSGGWIGLILALLLYLRYRVPTLRTDREFALLGIFLVTSGLGLWVMQGSNLITGKLLETGEHIKTLILPWLVFAAILLGTQLWKHRALLTKGVRVLSFAVLTAVALISSYYVWLYAVPFFMVETKRDAWLTEQSYARPFAWLESHEQDPVVVWSNPFGSIAPTLPVHTKHFTLYTSAGMAQLVGEGEIRERFLVSQYFDNPTIDDLTSTPYMAMYLGRHDFPHEAKTIERGIKICRILFFWKKNSCGVPPTPHQLLGAKFFENLEQKFTGDIRPHIKAYLAKYHVTYILKDIVLDPQYRPEKLGATRVYTDGRYELWHL